ncbi:hypothetical protein BpHYR1_051030 [Brachionus plicatilis]|uniref:Uncharacterized protein n=1 Tax=Brachionus plicatilis TaxID=10195 RepID=A0A3M7SQV8_BRAPC|nr:hypothetical protein BpHYR1_051030 [Brachionus plicatilis]
MAADLMLIEVGRGVRRPLAAKALTLRVVLQHHLAHQWTLVVHVATRHCPLASAAASSSAEHRHQIANHFFLLSLFLFYKLVKKMKRRMLEVLTKNNEEN